MMNVINGGVHARNSIDLQEFMVVPVGAGSFAEALRIGAEAYHALQRCSTTAGSRRPSATRAASRPTCRRARRRSRRSSRPPSAPATASASRSRSTPRRPSSSPTAPTVRRAGSSTAPAWPTSTPALVDRYPIVSIEDGLAEDDWGAWKALTERLGERVQLVGDDLFVTNPERLRRGIDEGVANSILDQGQPDRDADRDAGRDRAGALGAGYSAVMSHRSGETEDATIADLAVATGVGQIKTGAPARTDRVAKYNQLLRIEEELGGAAVYPGWSAFPRAAR